MIEPSDIRLSTMTVRRSPEYIHTTLSSLLLSDPLACHLLKGLHLVVGGADSDYLRHYGHHRRMTLHSLPEQDAKRSREWTTHRKFCFNYHRCLTLVPTDCAGLCVCEDDVIFQDRFIEKMLEAINELEEKKLEKYALDLYITDYLRPDSTFRSGRSCRKYDARTFFGTQCMFYSRGIISELAEFIHRNGVDDYRAPGDVLIRQYLTSTDCLYGAAHSLVQHIGLRSTGLAGMFHRSSDFNEEVTEIDTSEANPEKASGEKINLNLEESLQGSLKWLGQLAQMKGLELICNIKAAERIVMADPSALRRAVITIVRSVINFVDQGDIVFESETEMLQGGESRLHCCVRITGLAPDKRATFATIAQGFETDSVPFLNRSTAVGDSRDVVRLANIPRIVQKMGGTAWIDTGMEQLGNSLHFTVPIRFPQTSAPQSAGVGRDGLQDLPILVVDDNNISRKLKHEVVSSWGMKPTSLGSGQAALERLQGLVTRGEPFPVVLLDADMPGIDGFSLARRMKESLGFSQATIMMLSPSEGDDAGRCRELGIDLFLTKPVLKSELLEAIRLAAVGPQSKAGSGPVRTTEDSLTARTFLERDMPIPTFPPPLAVVEYASQPNYI